ncbi:MAG: DUF3616 domain-containing protein [Geminicoccaceae bacterium]
MPTIAAPSARLILDFSKIDDFDPHEIRVDLSAIAMRGDRLWLGNDERVAIEELTRVGFGTYGEHRSVRLDAHFPHLADDDSEMDIEGLDCAGDRLWFVGSHSLRRRRPKDKHIENGEVRDRLLRVEPQVNRFSIGFVPLADDDNGPRVADADDCDEPGRMLMGKRGVIDLLEDEKLLTPFFEVPAKENGFDIEGLAVAGKRLFLGLRGPVLRGWAVIVELKLKPDGDAGLKAKKIGPNDERYRLHLIELDGLGIRELAIDGKDLLILAGPTMDLDGALRVFRWRHALKADAPTVLPRADIAYLFDLPMGYRCDKAEGIEILPGEDSKRIAVVYDSPAPARLLRDGVSLLADVFDMPD